MGKLAIIQFGEDSEVTEAYQEMKKQKEALGYTVKEINMLHLTEEDKTFLAAPDLEQINIVGHSASWDPKNARIPIQERSIGDVSLLKACASIELLASATKCLKYNFYPCEIGDGFSAGTETRDIDSPNTIGEEDVLFEPDALGEERLRIEQLGAQASSFEVLRLALMQGMLKNPAYQPGVPMTIGAQVGPGDPEHATKKDSPRQSIPRHLARMMLSGATKDQKAEASKQAAAYQKQHATQGRTVWVQHKASVVDSAGYPKSLPEKEVQDRYRTALDAFQKKHDEAQKAKESALTRNKPPQ